MPDPGPGRRWARRARALPWQLRAAALVAVLAAVALAAAGLATPPAKQPQVLWGAWIGRQFDGVEPPADWTAVRAFEQRNAGGKRISVLNWSSPFSSDSCGGPCLFDVRSFRRVRHRGAIPFFSWANGGIPDRDVAAGGQDDYLRAWAKAAKAWGKPFFLRFAWEMNAPWFSWGVGNAGTTARDYVAMWRHVHDVFARVGARNVTWVWCPNADPHRRFADVARLYPGDRYVDWTCLDGYNADNPWTSFTSLFARSYDRITRKVAPTKPMIVGEVGSTEGGGRKARWIADMMAALPKRFPRIRGLLWFDKVEVGPNGATDWPIESSPASSAAFAAGVRRDTFASGTFSRIDDAPIVPAG
jgi:hypothetical protein